MDSIKSRRFLKGNEPFSRIEFFLLDLSSWLRLAEATAGSVVLACIILNAVASLLQDWQRFTEIRQVLTRPVPRQIFSGLELKARCLEPEGESLVCNDVIGYLIGPGVLEEHLDLLQVLYKQCCK